MKSLLLAAVLVAGGALRSGAQDAATLAIVEDKIQKLRSELEDVQFRLRKNEEEVAAIRKDLGEARTGAAAEQLQALEGRIAAVDAARQRDKQAIIDQLAKELAALGSGTQPPGSRTAAAKEHIVQKGENLTHIAKLYGVTVAELKKANNLTTDNLNIDQKLVIPK